MDRVTIKDLVDHLSGTLNMDPVWLSNLCRYLRQDRVLPNGLAKRGGMAPITPEHAGFVLLAALAAEHARGCTEFIKRIRDWRPARVQWGEESTDRAFLQTVLSSDLGNYFPAQCPDPNQTLGRVMTGIFDASVSDCYPCLDISVSRTSNSFQIDVTLAVAGHGTDGISDDPECPSCAIVLSYVAPDQHVDRHEGVVITNGISKATIAKLSTLFTPIHDPGAHAPVPEAKAA